VKYKSNTCKDENTLDSLYNDYVDDLYLYAQNLGFDKQTSMDAIHDVFCKLCTNKNLLSTINDAKFYLFRSLKNRLIDIYREQRGHLHLPFESLVDEIPFTIKVTVEDEMMNAEEEVALKNRIDEILYILTDRQREIIYLRYMHNYDYPKIAELMHITIPACHKLMHKTLSKLKKKNALSLILLLSLLS